MAVEYTISNVPCTMGTNSSNKTNDNLTGTYVVTVNQNSAKTGFNVSVTATLKSVYAMYWAGEGTLKVVVTWGGGSASETAMNTANITTALNGSGNITSSTSSAVTVSNVGTTSTTSIKVGIIHSLTRTTGSECNISGTGPCYTGSTYGTDPNFTSSGHAHYRELTSANNTINLSSIALGNPPVIKDLTNTNAYNSNQALSVFHDAISFSWDKASGGDVVSSEYRLNGGSWQPTSNIAKHSVIGLTANTKYKVEVRSKNADGYSNILSKEITTQVSPPVIGNITNQNPYNGNQSISASHNSITIHWQKTGGTDVVESYYSTDGTRTWAKSPGIADLTLTGLSPNTTYTITVVSRNSYYTSNYTPITGVGTPGQSVAIAIQVTTQIAPTVIYNLTNKNPLFGNQSVSASQNSISLWWDKQSGSDVVTSYYRINDGTFYKTSNIDSHTITGLTAGTTYKIGIVSQNSLGYPDGNSNEITMNVRTRHAAPNVSLEFVSKDLEKLEFKWSSDKALTDTYYKIDNDTDWTYLDQTGTSGPMRMNNLSPNSTHTIWFRGYSTNHDSVWSGEPSVTATTYDIARLTNAYNYTFGESITCRVTSFSSKSVKLKIQAGNSGNTYNVDFDASDGTNTYTFTREQLDAIYKKYTDSNTIPIKLTLRTIGDYGEYDDTEQSKTQVLTLTGIQPTGRIGISNSPKRAYLYIGVDGKPRRAVAWIGDSNNKPRRCT